MMKIEFFYSEDLNEASSLSLKNEEDKELFEILATEGIEKIEKCCDLISARTENLDTETYRQIYFLVNEYKDSLKKLPKNELIENFESSLDKLVWLVELKNPIKDRAFSKSSFEDKEQGLIDLLQNSEDILVAMERSVNQVSTSFFPVDIFSEIQDVFKTFKIKLQGVKLSAGYKEEAQRVLKQMEAMYHAALDRNPVFETLEKNNGVLLIHTASLADAKNLIEIKSESPVEICTSVSDLWNYHDLFSSEKRPPEVGVVYGAENVIRVFDRDVASKIDEGGRRYLLEPSKIIHEADSLDEAIKKRGDRQSHIEAWVDATETKAIGLVVVNEEYREQVKVLAQEFGLPVIYNSNLLKKSPDEIEDIVSIQ